MTDPRIKIFKGEGKVYFEIGGDNGLKIEFTPHMARYVGEGLFKTGCAAEKIPEQT